MNRDKLEDYLSMEYPVSFVKNEDGYEAWHPDLGRGSVSAYAPTLDEALSELNEARTAAITFHFEQGLRIPLPTGVDFHDYSGHFVVRIPKTLHAKLVRDAKENGVSLNSYVVHLLSERRAESRTMERFVNAREV
ncbi:MAG: toxin-antitoxin system HicB family antitoxin [Candidatus Electryoneaceae bacterium]|nr:toxin-antitoxin system HicB family antitoxin [Candidatus Electryoneaceae bacterium]